MLTVADALAVVEGFALEGGLPETYRAARPFPGAAAGNLLARTVESLGIISVSSVYSGGDVSNEHEDNPKSDYLPSLEFSL